MIVHLTSASDDEATTASVGGKASSLAKLYAIAKLQDHVPKSYALSTAFFEPWTMQLQRQMKIMGEKDCARIKEACMALPIDAAQQGALEQLSTIVAGEFSHGLAAVRSSAVVEDGADLSYAGVFQTELGVTPATLETAVRKCFASKFDYQVASYEAQGGDAVETNDGFAVVVMEMIDSVVAGVSFSANPLNSDRDECIVDSAFGLGESVVDGSVTADRFVVDKVQMKLIRKIAGNKPTERRLNLVEGGGATTLPINDEDRQNGFSLSDAQVLELAQLICIVEEEYGLPVDVEWAYSRESRLVLLQARPITTLYQVDAAMMTAPGERRILYYDANITQDATTTSPFSHLDMSLYTRASVVIGGCPPDVDAKLFFNNDPTRPLFCGENRIYANMSLQFNTRQSTLTATLFRSSDCDRSKYRMKRLPKGINLRNTYKLARKLPLLKLNKIAKTFEKRPEEAVANYKRLVKEDLAKLKELERQGYDKEKGLHQYSQDLFCSLAPSMEQEMGSLLFSILGTYKRVEKKSRTEKAEESRAEYGALCQGFEGDELMEINIAMHRLANKLGSIWKEYGHEDLPQLAERIEMNVSGVISDLPSDFVAGWTEFLDKYGWDREDQMFISSPSYRDDHVFLLARLRQNWGIPDPAIKLKEQLERRREVMKLHEERAASKRYTKPLLLKKIQKRNAILDQCMWIRNAPKLHISQMLGVLRANVLKAEEYLLEAQILEEKGDIFHLDLEEVDKALFDDTVELMSIVRPRKAIYERAKKSECPLLVDSRCRILRPDPPSKEDVEAGTLIGAAVSPGVASGRVRIVNNPHDRFEQGEVLAAVVTNPTWTPLFAGASAVILQMGGALQHGALCAREYGRPAVSSIDVHGVLRTGMLVEVDGNAGTVKIVEEN
ncbi:hypothetical protein ACHAXT_011903 [Thalassiosira profunda]